MKKIRGIAVLAGLMAGAVTQGDDSASRPEPIPQPDGTIRLSAASATLPPPSGTQIEYSGAQGSITGWKLRSDTVEWSVLLATPGIYSVTAELGARRPSRLTLSFGQETVPCAIPATGEYNHYQPIWLGMVTVKTPGEHKLLLTPDKRGWQPVNLRSVTLSPANRPVAAEGE